MTRKETVVVVLVLLVVLAGCGRFERYPPGEEILIQYDGTIEATDDGFRMNGAYFVGGSGKHKNSTFSNTTLHLYSEAGDVLAMKRLGTFDESIDVQLSINRTPEYVILDSPDFWRKGHVSVEYYYRQPEGYNWEQVSSRESFPVTPHEDERNQTEMR